MTQSEGQNYGSTSTFSEIEPIKIPKCNLGLRQKPGPKWGAAIADFASMIIYCIFCGSSESLEDHRVVFEGESFDPQILIVSMTSWKGWKLFKTRFWNVWNLSKCFQKFQKVLNWSKSTIYKKSFPIVLKRLQKIS